MQSRGFAFVSYYQKSDAESAMQALQGYGYDHLILKLEWAKPSLVSEKTAQRVRCSLVTVPLLLLLSVVGVVVVFVVVVIFCVNTRE